METYRDPVYKPIIVADIQGYSDPRRLQHHRAAARDGLRRALRKAFDTILDKTETTWDDCEERDTGDGSIILIPPHTSINPMVRSLAHELSGELRWHNDLFNPKIQVQARVSLHVGPVPADGTSDAVILACRLVDAKPLREALAASPDDAVGLIASDSLYREIIQNDPRANPRKFRTVPVHVKETETTGWIYLS